MEARYAACARLMEQITGARVFDARPAEAPDDAVAWIEAAPTGEPTIEFLPLDVAQARAVGLDLRCADVLASGSAPYGGVLTVLACGAVGSVMAYMKPKAPKAAKARPAPSAVCDATAEGVAGTWRVAAEVITRVGQRPQTLNATADKVEEIVLRADGTFVLEVRTPAKAGWQTTEGTWKIWRGKVRIQDAALTLYSSGEPRRTELGAGEWHGHTLHLTAAPEHLEWRDEALSDSKLTRRFRRVVARGRTVKPA